MKGKVIELAIVHPHRGDARVTFTRRITYLHSVTRSYTLDTPHKFSAFYHKLYRVMCNNLMHSDYRINAPVPVPGDKMTVTYVHYVNRNVKQWERIQRHQLREEY